MFTKLNTYGAASSRGFTVQRKTRDAMEYAEGDHVAVIPVEPGVNDNGQPYLAVYASSPLHWLPPHAEERIMPAKHQEITGNVREALEFLRLHFVLE